MEADKPKEAIANKCIGFKTEWKEFETTPSKCILYALGIGAQEDPLNTNDFKFTYENDPDFTSFPTMSCVLNINDLFPFLSNCPGIPEMNPMMILHGEQFMDNTIPLPTNNKLKLQSEIVDIEERGSGTVFCSKTTIVDEKDTVCSITHSNIFARGVKCLGYKSKDGALKRFILPKLPTTTPNIVIEVKTRPDQAILYRLGGNDLNPLHIDPEMAKMGKFEKPILHGLCSLGITAKAIFENYCKGSVQSFQKLGARFTSHVFPGETLVISCFNSGSKVAFSVATKERKLQVILGEVEIVKAKF